MHSRHVSQHGFAVTLKEAIVHSALPGEQVDPGIICGVLTLRVGVRVYVPFLAYWLSAERLVGWGGLTSPIDNQTRDSE